MAESSSLLGPIEQFAALNPDTVEQIGRAWMGHTSHVRFLSLSPDGLKLATSSFECNWVESGTIRFWDTTSGNSIGSHLLDSHANVLSFSPSGDSWHQQATARYAYGEYLGQIPSRVRYL